MAGRAEGAPAARRARAPALAAFAALLAFAGCTPLYVPLVPEPVPAPERLAFGPGSGLAREAGVPVLTLEPASVPEGGWLSVQWFGPDEREAASAAVRLEPGAASPLRLPLPADVAEGREDLDGRWRAVVSFGGAIVRQYSLPAVGEPGGA